MSNCIRSTNIVFIPGMMCDQRLWRHQAEALAPSYQIYYGCMVDGCSIEAIAGDILATAPPTFALAGLSMGAIVAFEMWRQAPQRIERMALLDTNHRADAPERYAIRNRQIAQVQAGQLTRVLKDELKPNYLAQCHRNNSELLEEVLVMGLDLGAEVFVRQSTALRDRLDSSSTLATMDCPVSIVCGDEDSLCAVSLHEEMAESIPHATLEIVERCGHLSTLEQPHAVNDALARWLQAA